MEEEEEENDEISTGQRDSRWRGGVAPGAPAGTASSAGSSAGYPGFGTWPSPIGPENIKNKKRFG